jgi:hypothetical protein
MGEEVGTMQIGVLGEIKMNLMRGEKNPKYLTCQKEKRKKSKKTKKRKRKKIE